MLRTRIEDYLTAIEQLCVESAVARAKSGAIARLLGISNGTASSMLKQLANRGLVVHRPYEGVSLTEQGRSRSRHFLRRCRLLELFLSKTLGVPWESVADEARQWEPAISDPLLEKIDEFLSRPRFDPHGDPARCLRSSRYDP